MGTTASSGNFPQTRWSVVLATRHTDDHTSRQALAELCESYWFPLYAFARRKGFAPEDAKDATQSFFHTVVREDMFASTGQEKGRLRTFLMRSFERDLLDSLRASKRQKRGGGAELLSLDLSGAEDRFLNEHPSTIPAEAEFDQAWARTIVASALKRVEAEYSAQGKDKVFGMLKGFISAEEPGRAKYDDIACQLGLSRAATRQAVHRLRQQFREVLRGEIAETLENPTTVAIEDELETLRVALGAAA